MKILFIALMAMSCNESEKNRIVCHTVCQQDQDELGVMINGSCYCANKRDIKFVPSKIRVKGSSIVDKLEPKKWNYDL